MSKIYVGNLPFSATEDSVRTLFAQFGTVESVALINDRETGRPRGFGFVEMSKADAAPGDSEPERPGHGRSSAQGQRGPGQAPQRRRRFPPLIVTSDSR